MLIFQILNVLIEMTTEASAYASCGLVLIPLPSSAALWTADSPETWKAEFKLHSDEKFTYGVSNTGVLTRLLIQNGGARIFSEEWEEWRADVGEIGTLVMMVGALL